MQGVPRSMAEHRLQTYKAVEPIAQKRRNMGGERSKDLEKQVKELLKAGIIREVRYQTWVANPVMVKKSDGSWRMCIDYKDLNKACPKDCYPLPEIDLKVDSLAPFRLKCFLDAYKGYHQIQMAIEDEDKTAFRTNIVIKNNEEEVMLKDIEETLERLRNINMKLNPVKCSFSMEEGKFLGVMVTKDGFRPNPYKVLAIAWIPSPTSLKEPIPMDRRSRLHVSRNERLPYGSSYPNRANTRRNTNPITVCIRKGSGRRATGTKKGGSNSHLLRQQSLNWPRDKPELLGRLAQWAIELGAHRLTYKPRLAIKGQVLADFVSEIPQGKVTECAHEEEEQHAQGVKETWSLFTDGASNEEVCGAGLRLLSPEGNDFTYAVRLEFKSTNNEAEYEALLAGLRIAKKMGAKHIEARVDSLLVSGQVNGTYDAKEPVMILYLEQMKDLMRQFDSCTVIHIKRSENKQADALSKLASTSFSHLAKEVRVEVLNTPSVQRKQVNVVQTGAMSWMTPILNYLNTGALPEERPQARKLQHKALQYQLQDGILYHRSYLGPLLRCVDAEDSNYLIREIHESICGMPAPRTIRPKNNLVPVTTSWPFQKWAIDTVGPFPEAPGRVKLLIVAIDYFTKWVQAKPVGHHHSRPSEKVPMGKHYMPLRDTNAPGYKSAPRPMGTLVGRRATTCVVGAPYKSKNKQWVDTIRLTYGSEAVIHAEIGVPSARVLIASKNDNSQEIRINLDLLDERRKEAALQEARYKKKLEKYYNARVKICKFNIDDYVLRDNEASRAEHPGKLSPNWEGPYQIATVLGKGEYELKKLDGTPIPTSWNVAQLRKCYM
ncbi:hypothetical protein L1987_81708 [Smallanthus sonchifolius]|uniref:Uncharacterized protein n=1 Tax=Smallanthus sonchifolius TaxID=185202 RepID=A0ACB8YRU3_9ASTR|nr:hypothetical protein L1987_81708 [Smallanthus sonchifolius]